jgi:hypothetical protein
VPLDRPECSDVTPPTSIYANAQALLAMPNPDDRLLERWRVGDHDRTNPLMYARLNPQNEEQCLRCTFTRDTICAMMRTGTKRKPKRLLHSNPSRLTDKSFRDEPDLRHVFRHAPELLDAITVDREVRRTFKRLISDGCAPEILLSLVRSCVWGEYVKGLHKKELDALKDRLDRIIRRLEALRTDVLSLGKTRIGFDPLWSSTAFESIDARVQTTFARDYMFTELPGSLAWAKAFATELKQAIAEEHSVRHETYSQMLAWLYLYCCAATRRRVTYREIADLLNAGLIEKGSEFTVSEGIVRMRVNRFQVSAAAMSYENLELLMKDYVRSCPTGDPSLWDWLSSNGAVWVSSHIKPMDPGRVISEKERRRLTLLEHRRLKIAARERPEK